jgi:hypothetical protein
VKKPLWHHVCIDDAESTLRFAMSGAMRPELCGIDLEIDGLRMAS